MNMRKPIMASAASLLLMCALAFLFTATGLPSDARALGAQEEKRVEALLAALEKKSELVFIRNGSEYSAAAAAQHLRLKLSRSGNALASAEEFIDKLGSVSSVSGKAYLVRDSEGKTIEARVFLHDLLKAVQAAP